MKAFNQASLVSVLLAAGLMPGAGSVTAYQAGDLVVRAGAAGVMPTGESDDLGGGAKVEADDAWSLASP